MIMIAGNKSAVHGEAWGRGTVWNGGGVDWGLTEFLPATIVWPSVDRPILRAYFGTSFGRWMVTWQCSDAAPGYVIYETTMAFLNDLEDISRRCDCADTGFYFHYGRLVAALDPTVADFIETLDAEYMAGIPGSAGA